MYIGYFRDNNDDSLYTVEIGTGSTTEITLSGTPFTTKMDNSDDIIYKPARGSLNDIVEHFETEEEAIKREEELNKLLLTK